MSGWFQTLYQESLESLLRQHVFPHHNIVANARKQVAITDARSGRNLEVDVWLPELNLCFEFQDFYHYKPAWYYQMPLHEVQQKDESKRIKLTSENQTLVAIPCWWGGDSTSLRETIHFQRPDLGLTQLKPAIPTNPPVSFLVDLSQLMLASFPEGPNANVMERGSWWLGEKWDGVRCVWDATQKQLYSRNKTTIDFQETAKRNLFGNVVLDAELWCGRGLFGESQVILASFASRLDFSSVRLLCFDEASIHEQYRPFESRYSLLLSHLSDDHPTVINAPRFMCCSEDTFNATLRAVTESGGEGVMLRQPLSPYIPGRSPCLFKIKASSTHGDQEALVVSADEGKLLLRKPNGIHFYVSARDCLLPRRPVQGDIVCFSFGVPSTVQSSPVQQNNTVKEQCTVYRIRTDVEWSDIAEWHHDGVENKSPHVPKGEREVPQTKDSRAPFGYRAFFDRFAAFKHMDPLNPVFWHHTTSRDLLRFDKRYKIISWNLGSGKIFATLKQAYPDIGLQKSEFQGGTLAWKQKKASRELFDAFAESRGVDELNPVFWYTVSPRELREFNKRYDDIVRHSGHKLSSILMHLYPDIGLQQSQFMLHSQRRQKRIKECDLKRVRHSYKFVSQLAWTREKAKAFFDKYAASKEMNPLNPFSWYSVTPVEILAYDRRYKSISRRYGGTLAATLMRLYPSIGLQQHLFKVNRHSWKQESVRKQFFDKFATSKGMEPLNPTFWYSVTPSSLLKYDKGYEAVSKYGKLPSILMQLYPSIGLQQEHFRGNKSVP